MSGGGVYWVGGGWGVVWMRWGRGTLADIHLTMQATVRTGRVGRVLCVGLGEGQGLEVREKVTEQRYKSMMVLLLVKCFQGFIRAQHVPTAATSPQLLLLFAAAAAAAFAASYAGCLQLVGRTASCSQLKNCRPSMVCREHSLFCWAAHITLHNALTSHTS